MLFANPRRQVFSRQGPNKKKDLQKKHRLGRVSIKINVFNGTNLTLNFGVDQDTWMFGLHEKHMDASSPGI